MLDKIVEWLINKVLSRRYTPDPTLGPRDPDPGVPYPQLREVNLQERFSKYPIRIAHISDLHFGRHSEAKITALKTFLKPKYFHLLAVSGDVVDFPRPEHFQGADTFLREVPIERIVAPGNHDRHARQTLGDFLSTLRVPIGPHSCNLYKFSREDALIVFVFNSTIATENRLIQVRGFVDSEQMRWFEGMVEYLRQRRQLQFESSLKIAILHHHPIPVKDSRGEKWLFLGNSGEFLKKLDEAGIDVVLHGHRHCPMTSTLSFGRVGREMLIVAGGTAAEKSDDGEEEQARLSETTSIHTLDIYEDRLVVHTHKYVNALRFSEKFKLVDTFTLRRRQRVFTRHERRMEYKIEGPNGDLNVIDLRRFRVSRRSSGRVRSIRFSAGNTVRCEYEQLGVRIERKRDDGSWVEMDASKVVVRREEDQIAVVYYLDVPLEPAPVFRDFVEEVRLLYRWPKGYVEVVEQDYDENLLGIFDETDVLEFRIELSGGRKIVSHSFIPEACLVSESDMHVEVRFEGLDEGRCVSYRLETRLG